MISLLRSVSTTAAALALAGHSVEHISAKSVVRAGSFLQKARRSVTSLWPKTAAPVAEEKRFEVEGLEELKQQIDILQMADLSEDDELQAKLAELQVELAKQQSREDLVNFFLGRFDKGEKGLGTVGEFKARMGLEAGILAFEKAEQANLEGFCASKGGRTAQGYLDVYKQYYQEAVAVWGAEQIEKGAASERDVALLRAGAKLACREAPTQWIDLVEV